MPEDIEKTDPMTETANKAKNAKKKRNRKKKGKKDQDDTKSNSSDDVLVQQQQQQQQQELPLGVKMNPHAILRHRIMQQGFTESQIDQAMEEMWNKNLAYDEYEAVLKYLKNDNQDVKEEAAPVAANAASQPSAAPESAEQDAVESAAGGIEESKEEGEGGETPEAKPAAAPKETVKPKTMEERLEIVAGFENMTDAIFALTEWISKAAKPRDLEALCATTKTQALVTIFHRSITEGKDPAQFDSSVLPSMVRLMATLLEKSGISSAGVAETQTTFETLLRQARRVHFSKHPNADEFAVRVSRFIVSRISLAIGESQTTTAAALNGHVELEPAEIPSAANGASTATDQDIADLLSKREIHQTATKRYGVLARSACGVLTAQTSSTPAELGGKRETEIEKTDIMLALLGEDSMAAFESQKAALEELKSKAEQGEAETIQELHATIEELTSERETVQQRIFELKASIEKLETYDAELCVKVNDVQKELEAETHRASAESNILSDQISEATKAIKFGTSVSGLVDMLKKYDDSLDQAIQASAQSPSKSDVDPVGSVGKQMEVFISRARNYFETEAAAVEFLRNRVNKAKIEIADLKTEIMECEGLGMDTTIGQMRASIKTKESLIEKDSALAERFVREATSIFESLLSRLEDYKAIGATNNVTPLTSELFGSIPSSLGRLGITSPERLDPFMMSMNGRSVGLKAAEPPAPHSAAPVGIPKTEERKLVAATVPVEKPAAKPKFTWATAKTTGDSTPKPSLLDIQKQELESETAS